jgi:hypothetical protein
MVVRESFEPWPQHDQSRFVPEEVLHEVVTRSPDAIGGFVDGGEDIEQVLNVHVLRHDPSGVSKPRPVGIEFG